MDAQQLVSQLEQLAEKLGVKVRYGVLDSPGGLCKLRSDTIVFVNELLPDDEKAAVLAGALSGFDTENIYLLPEVREALERHRTA